MPIESRYPPIDVPEDDLWTWLFESKREFPDDKVIYLDPYTSRSYTFAQVKSTALAFGTGLKAVYDWRKGDVLATFTPNSIDFPAVIWGCLWAGGIVSPANPGYTVAELAFQLKDAGARAIVTQLPMLQTAREAARKAGIDEGSIILLGDERDPQGRAKHFTSVRNIDGMARFRRAKINPAEDLAFIPYSSGTTGRPKGVMLTHTNIASNTLMQRTGEGHMLSWKGGKDDAGDRVMAFLPFFHIYGLTCLIHQAIHVGLTLVVVPKFELDKFCQIIQDQKLTFVYLVPPVLLLLAKHPIVSNYDLRSIRMINSGAAPLTKELVEAFYKRHNLPVKQGYGLSETSPTTHVQQWSDWRTTVGSVGKMLPNMTVKYMSADEKELPAGQTGELWIKGPNVFKGYLNNPAGSRDALTDDGFFKTGDIGYEDEQGNVYITDRLKELIKYKGFQVAPAELEGSLLDHPAIDDVAVIGIYNPDEATEVPRAYVVLAKGYEPDAETAEEIVGWLGKQLAQHKKLRGGVRFVDEIPKSVSGKILRRVLKERAREEEKRGKAKL